MKTPKLPAILFLLPFLSTLLSCSNHSLNNFDRILAQKEIGAEENDIFYRIDGAGNELFSITFAYLPKEQSDPLLLRVANLAVAGGGVQHAPIRIQTGTTFHRDVVYAQPFRRTDPKKDILIRLDFESRPGVRILVPASRSGDTLPVGTVVQSILDWEAYAATMEEPSAFDPGINRWAPCDGHDIAGSALAETLAKRDPASAPVTPDLRGVFLRGLNRFVADEASHGLDPVSEERQDPGEKKGARLVVRTRAGVLQGNNVGGHQHSYQAGVRPQGAANADHDKKDIHNVWHGDNWKKNGQERNTGKGPAGETRPRNVSVYYYIKIN